LDHWYDLLRETADVMNGWTIPCLYILSWILLGSFIFRNIFVGVMGNFIILKLNIQIYIHTVHIAVNNFQNIRQIMMAEQRQENSNLNAKLNIFALDKL
jgi:cation channel sperm-associated protein 2